MPADTVKSPRPGPVEPERVEDAFLTSPQLKALKIAVVVMGVILIVGFGVIVARIFYLTSNRPPPHDRNRVSYARSSSRFCRASED